jgi:hypothetical protein
VLHFAFVCTPTKPTRHTITALNHLPCHFCSQSPQVVAFRQRLGVRGRLSPQDTRHEVLVFLPQNPHRMNAYVELETAPCRSPSSTITKTCSLPTSTVSTKPETARLACLLQHRAPSPLRRPAPRSNSSSNINPSVKGGGLIHSVDFVSNGY